MVSQFPTPALESDIPHKRTGQHLPGFEKVCNGKDKAEDDTKASHHNIRDPKKRIFAAHDCSGCYKDGFGAAVNLDREIYSNQYQACDWPKASLQSEILTR